MRALYPIANDRFFAGRGAALASAIESTIDFQRDQAGKIISLVWGRDGDGPRIARRVSIERSEDLNNILAEKNKAAWEAALKAGGNRDYTLRILPHANHLLLEAKIGSNAEMPNLQRFVPVYFATIRDWLAKRIQGSVRLKLGTRFREQAACGERML